MNVQQVIEKISSLPTTSPLGGLNIEFVTDAKKLFIKDVKAGTDTMKIEITRKMYRPYNVEEFKTVLSHAGPTLECEIVNLDANGATKAITDFFATNHAIEIVVE
ncbi:MAG: hypothetical protein GY909_03280 [Oligoflexia bacterium]|nr:hypothetical protein [Oligoflexia bacterium]